MTATNAEKVAAVVQRQNVQHGFVLLCVLPDCYFADHCSAASLPLPSLTYLAAAAAAITCVAAVPFLGLQSLGIVTIVASVDEALRC